MFRRFLESYIDVCNNIITESANAVLMFEAGEQAALDIKTTKLDDIKPEFERQGINVNIEPGEKKLIFKVKGLPFGKKCKYCDILRGFFGGISRKHVDHRYYCKKGVDCAKEGAAECSFIVEISE